jgi:hypothetical protein
MLTAPTSLTLRATDIAGNTSELVLPLNLSPPSPAPEPTPAPEPQPVAEWLLWVVLAAALVAGAILVILRGGKARP